MAPRGKRKGSDGAFSRLDILPESEEEPVN